MKTLPRILAILMSAVMITAFSGCETEEDPLEETGDAIEDAAEETGDAIEEATD